MSKRKPSLQDRLLSNSPDPIKSSILRESGMGWNPNPQVQNTGSISSTSSSGSDSLVNPLRIEKRDTPVRARPIIPRRTSSSYKHMHSNNLVSKSPFKSQIPTPATPSKSSKPTPIAISFPMSPGRRVSGEKRQRPSSMHELAETDNSRPLALKRERKQSKAFEVLLEREPVSKSPFRQPDNAPDSEDLKSASLPIPIPTRRPVSLTPELLVPSPAPSPSRQSPSPGRPALVSRRMHGPRLSGSGRRERRKTVTFDERCDVVEFDRDDDSDNGVFESTSEEEDASDDNSMHYDDDEQTAMPGEEEDSYTADRDDAPEDSYESIALELEDKQDDSAMALDPDASITGIVDNLFFSEGASSLADNSLASVANTPPRQSSLPPDLETEDGVPLGRSHHVERFLQHHSPHLGPQRISPRNSPGHSPGRYPFNLNLPTQASPNGPPATPPRRSPGMTHSTPPLGRSTHAERVKEVREQENDEIAHEVNNLPPSPSPMKIQSARERTEDALIPRFDLAQDVSSSAPGATPDVTAAARSVQLDHWPLDEAPPADLDASAENDNPADLSAPGSYFDDRSTLDEPSRIDVCTLFLRMDPYLHFIQESAYDDADSGDDDDHELNASTNDFLAASPLHVSSGSPGARAGSPMVRSGSPLTRLSSPLSTSGLQVANRPRINKDDVKRRLMGRRSLCSPSPEPRSPERSTEHRASPLLSSEANAHLTPSFIPQEQDRDKDRDRMSIMTGMTDMSTDTAIVGHAERGSLAVASLVSPCEADEDDEFGVLGSEDRLKFDFGSKFSIGGLGVTHSREDDDEEDIDSTDLTTPQQTGGGAGFPQGAGMRMGDQDVDMDMKSALDRLMEDVAGGRVDDSILTDDSFVSQDSQATDLSLLEPVTNSRPKFLERAATDTLVQTTSASGITSRNVSGSSSSAMPPPVPPKDNIKAREQMILQKRRQARGLDDDQSEGEYSGEDDSIGPLAKMHQKRLGVGRPSHRRSMSTGDVEDLTEHQKETAMLELSQVHSDTLLGNIEQELNKMQEPPKKKRYQIRERANTIVASSSDERVQHLHGVGDVHTDRPWRPVRRESDMNQYAREIRAWRAEDKSKAYGKVFVKVLGIKHIHVPMPREPTAVSCTLNNGIHFVSTPDCPFAESTAIEQEFELIEHNKLEFTLAIKVRMDPHIKAQMQALVAPAVRPPPPVVTPLPPLMQTHSKSSSRFSLFSSKGPTLSHPRLDAPSVSICATPSTTLKILAVTSSPMALLPAPSLRSRTSFTDVTPACFETSYPLIGQRAELGGKYSTQQIGEIVVQMFRLPPLPGVPQDELPQSLEDCHKGLRHINWHKVTYYQGTLTQNGGDCSTWRRRQFRVMGGQLIAFNDLRRAIRLDDEQDMDDEAMYGVERSFRLVFPHEEIVFFADTDEEKAKWLEVLRALVGHIPPHPLWAELLWQRQDEITKRAQGCTADGDEL
ncbi:hypothetical protein DFP72DRAFT_1030227 [Ephemerocybe angulata]|uniref:PH domain-containing protein n=1 Tax=Ephemerocybe angulata TaxID=980116 RepID=A0A8H6IEN4_9AGAR|nr:hypothetical protein DFP72DRAFT_1030227 [Tulosesus angulatus]